MHPIAKKKSNPSNTIVIEVTMIPHINIKNPATFNSENSRIKKDMKNHFSSFTHKIDLIYLLQKPKLPKTTFNSRVLFHKVSYKRKNFKLCKSTVVTKTSNAETGFF